MPILHLSPFSKGIGEAAAFSCGRGSSLVCTTPPVVPLAKGDKMWPQAASVSLKS